MAKDEPTGEVIPARSLTPVHDAVKAAATYQDKLRAGRDAMTLISLPDLARPVPKLFVDLPWQDREEAQADILARLIAAPTLEEATAAQDELPDLSTYVGKTLTLWGGVARPGTIEDAWGAYVSLDITVGGEEVHQVVNTSSAEVVVIFWRARCEGKLPLTGQVVLKGNPTPGRNQPIGFMTMEPFE